MLRSRSSSLLAAVGLFAFAAVLRLPGLTRGFDLDEMATAAWAIARTPLAALETLRYPIEGNAAGYPLGIWAWARFGHAEWWLRMPSVLAGACTVVVFFRRNSARFTPGAALGASLLLAVAWLPLLESQNARCYSLYALFSYLALDSWERHKQWPFAACALVSVSLHHFAWLYLAPLALFSIRRPRAWIPFAAIVVGYLPQVPLLVHQLRGGPGWIPSVTPALLAKAAENLLQGGSTLLAIALAALIALGAAARFRALRQELAWTLFPLCAGVALSVLVRPVFQDQYFYPSVLGLFGALAGALDFAGGRPRAALTATLATVSLATLPAFYAREAGDDWRGASAHLLAHATDCGNELYTDPYWMNRWPYYLGDQFRIHHWNEGMPSHPFWLAGAGHPPLPKSIAAIAERVSKARWEGRNAVVYCMRP